MTDTAWGLSYDGPGKQGHWFAPEAYKPRKGTLPEEEIWTILHNHSIAAISHFWPFQGNYSEEQLFIFISFGIFDF